MFREGFCSEDDQGCTGDDSKDFKTCAHTSPLAGDIRGGARY